MRLAPIAIAAAAGGGPAWGVLAELEAAGLVTLAELRCCRWRAGQLAKAIHALEIHTA